MLTWVNRAATVAQLLPFDEAVGARRAVPLLAAPPRLGREQSRLRHGLMACRFGQVLLIGGLLRRARFGLTSTCLRITLLRIAWLRVARLPALAVTRRLIAVSCTRRARSACGCMAVAPLPVRRAWRARGFGGKVGRRHEAVHCHFPDLALDQPLDALEKRQLFAVHQRNRRAAAARAPGAADAV